jgi:hypothetical protein
MHEPWRLVLLTAPDGSTVPARVWLPPLPGVDSGPGVHSGPGVGSGPGAGRDRHPVLPVQRVPAGDADADRA